MEILSRLEIKDRVNLARTSKLFQTRLPIEQAAYYVAVKPDPSEITRILSSVNNELLKKLLRTPILDVATPYELPIINYTLLQLAYGGYDAEICHLIKDYYEHAFDSNEAGNLVQLNIKQKFTENNMNYLPCIQNLLSEVIKAISVEMFNMGKECDNKIKLNKKTISAINLFRDSLNKIQRNKVSNGMHCDLHILLETYMVFVQVAENWCYNKNKCDLFQDGVLSSVLYNVPANIAQRFCQGLKYLLLRNEDFKRSLNLRANSADSTNNYYEYLNQPSDNFSNLNGRCIDIMFGEKACFGATGAKEVIPLLRTLISIQRKGLQSLNEQQNPQLMKRF